MITFKDLKKLVELPSYKEQRVPTVKALEVSGVPVVAEKILENPDACERLKDTFYEHFPCLLYTSPSPRD